MKNRYSDEKLKEFRTLIVHKLEKAERELEELKESINENRGNMMKTGVKIPEDTGDVADEENANYLAGRQFKYIQHLKQALKRVDNQTFGVCVQTGKLIDEHRLKAVPHTTHSIEAKRGR